MDCWQQLPFIPSEICSQCGYVFEYATGDKNVKCISCQEEPPYYDEVRSIWFYDEITKPLIMKLKYADRIELARYMAPFFQQIGDEFFENIDFACPVPLHWTRQWQRGYNQSALLGQYLEDLNIPFIRELLERVKKTKPQGHFHPKKRQLNLADAFQVNQNWKNNIKDKNILIIDDVFTTGATANECAKILKKYDAASVKITTIARVKLKQY